jgi:glutamate N-acetyltransferase/amino-acid N-acetyltransferase
MTTDTQPKIAEASIRGSSARIVGVAKGVGMIEPDMATHISLVFTDAALSRGELETVFRSTVERTFNRVSIDTDTSTSDTTVCLASGASGAVDRTAFADALHAVLLSLTKQIARDGEGAERIIEVRVDRARDEQQAVTVARSIVNSPLVKTAVHGADPNWGRVAMAVGKCSQYTDIKEERVVIRFGSQEVFPTQLNDADLAQLSSYMRSEEVLIHVSLNTGDAQATVWGCDLSAGYVRINADYTT